MAPLVYEDFNVRLAHLRSVNGEKRFNVWVEGRTAAGSMRPDDEAELIWDPNEFWDEPGTVFGGLAGKPEDLRVEEHDLRALGEKLADLALPEGKVRTLFTECLKVLQAKGKGLRLRLHLDPLPLARLPWEYLMLPDGSGGGVASDFLALREEVSIVRSSTVEWMSSELPSRDHYRFLGVLSMPDGVDSLDLEKDRKAVEITAGVLNDARVDPVLSLDWVEDPASKAALRHALDRGDGIDIFHFGGHGLYDIGTREGALLFEKTDGVTLDKYGADELALRLRRSGVRLVLLGACESSKGSAKNAWSGIAQALTRQRIPAVIGNQFELRDDLAGVLLYEVYNNLFRGLAIDQALARARIAIVTEYGLEARDWGVPTLYLHDETGVLFPVAAAASDNESERSLADVAAQLERQGREDEPTKIVGLAIDEMRGGTVNVKQAIKQAKVTVIAARVGVMDGGVINVTQVIGDDGD